MINRTLISILAIFLVLKIRVGICDCKLPCPVPITIDVKCGSNGVTYQNLQELLCAKVHCEPSLYLVHNGDCRNRSLSRPLEQFNKNTTSGFKLSFPKQKLSPGLKSAISTGISKELIGEQNLPSTLPPASQQYFRPTNHIQEPKTSLVSPCLDHCDCEYILSPVCASNQITYGNRCLFKCVQECEPKLELHHQGFCGKIFFYRKPILKLPFFRAYAPEAGLLI